MRFAELSTDETSYVLLGWTSNTMTPTVANTTSVITVVPWAEVNTLISINGDKFSGEHPILVFNGETYTFVQAQDVQVGWQVLKRTAGGLEGLVWTEVTEAAVLEETSWVYRFDTENDDVLFTANLLSHNLKGL